MIQVNENPVEWKEGMTVDDALKAMNYDFVYIIVMVNGKYVPTEEYKNYKLPDNADVKAIHLHHGG